MVGKEYWRLRSLRDPLLEVSQILFKHQIELQGGLNAFVENALRSIRGDLKSLNEMTRT